MTPGLLAKIRDLVKAGARVVGNPPVKSPSLSGYPDCDEKVRKLAKDLWGSMDAPQTVTKRAYGKGAIHWGGELSAKNPPLYPAYEQTAAILKAMGVIEDFIATGPVRYGHRRTKDRDIYFVSNRTAESIKTECRFRVAKGDAQLWDPVTAEMRPLPQVECKGVTATIPMEFDAYQSFFIVFEDEGTKVQRHKGTERRSNFPELKAVQELSGPWDVCFDTKLGAPEKVAFDTLQDWTTRPEPGIKYYSGIAVYRKVFDFAPVISNQFSVISNKSATTDYRSLITENSRLYLSLGTVHDMARVKLNGKDLGVVWCAPWRVDISSAVKEGTNELEIEVVNRWANRMIGDKQSADANVRTVKSPDGFLAGKEFKTGRYTFSTHDPYNAKSPLVASGLLGPVQILKESAETK